MVLEVSGPFGSFPVPHPYGRGAPPEEAVEVVFRWYQKQSAYSWPWMRVCGGSRETEPA